MTLIDAQRPVHIGSILDTLKDIRGFQPSPDNFQVYRTTAFTKSLATAAGGWIPVAVKATNLGQAYGIIAESLHRRYPLLFTSPQDIIFGTTDLNFELNPEFSSIVGFDPHDMPAYVAFPTGPFRWRSQHRQEGGGHDSTPDAGLRGFVPPPDEPSQYPTGYCHPMRYSAIYLVDSLGDLQPRQRLYRCPICSAGEYLNHGDEAVHSDHRITLRGAVINAASTDANQPFDPCEIRQ